MSISAHVCAYAIDRVEPEPEIKREQVQGVWTRQVARILTLLLDQGKPQCIRSPSLICVLINIFMLRMIVY
jgi:hypothetical protein